MFFPFKNSKHADFTHKGLADLYSSVSESSSSEYWVSPLPPARRPRATRSPAAFPYPVYFNRLSTKQATTCNENRFKTGRFQPQSEALFLTHRSLCRGRRETPPPLASRPCPRVSWGEPACSWWCCPPPACSSHPSEEEGPDTKGERSFLTAKSQNVMWSLCSLPFSFI